MNDSINKKGLAGAIAVFMLFFALLFAFAGCAMNVLPEAELKKLNPQKILDLAAEKYSNYDYEEAVYYYSSIGKLFPQDSDDVNDQKAWAIYEIGYVRYQQGRTDEALKYFSDTLKTKSRSNAPRILAAEMIDRIRNKK